MQNYAIHNCPMNMGRTPASTRVAHERRCLRRPCCDRELMHGEALRGRGKQPPALRRRRRQGGWHVCSLSPNPDRRDKQCLLPRWIRRGPRPSGAISVAISLPRVWGRRQPKGDDVLGDWEAWPGQEAPTLAGSNGRLHCRPAVQIPMQGHVKGPRPTTATSVILSADSVAAQNAGRAT